MSCKKTGGSAVLKRQRSSKRALVRFLYFASFVLNRMPIAGDKLPAFLRRIVPGERGGVLCSYHLFKHTMDYHPIYMSLAYTCSSTVRCSFLRSASAELTEMPPTVPSHHP